MTDYKLLIIENLSILQKKEVHDKNFFKARAYSKILSQLKNLILNILMMMVNL